ncbi:hypothetical protein, partial [Leptospira weilii]|uniref:hypothetical protein n=1 Tax=Leptospira weilii TaxID=28184 RepID=UPI00047526D3
NKKWMVINNRYYLDDQTGTQREIDLLAYQISVVENFLVYTVVLVSCKKSDENSWVFLTKSINANDPNIKFLPIDTWTNIKIFTEMDHINYIQKNVSDEIQKEDSSIRDFFHLERNIFAFQEVHVDKQAPRNDKNIYDSLVSLLKAKEYERNTLDNRKKRQCLYNFVCLSVQEVPTIEYFCDSNPPGIQEVDHIKYLNRFIINKKDDFHLVHFIHKKKLISFIDGLDSLHLWFVQKYTEIISEYKKMLLNSSSLLNIYLTEIRKALSFQIYYRLTYTYKISIEEPTKLTLGADSEGITMLIYLFFKWMTVSASSALARRLIKERDKLL